MHKKGLTMMLLIALLAMGVHATAFNYYKHFNIAGHAVRSARWESPRLQNTTPWNLSREAKPGESQAIYIGQSCDTLSHTIYFVSQGSACRFPTPDHKRNQWSCAGHSSLRCRGHSCPPRACRTPGHRTE